MINCTVRIAYMDVTEPTFSVKTLKLLEAFIASYENKVSP